MQQTFFQKMSALLGGKKKWIIAISFVVLIIIAYLIFQSGKNSGTNLAVVIRGAINQEVMVSGTVKPTSSVNLAFEKSGTISWVNKNAGEKVYAGEVIVTLQNGAEEATLENAEAQLKSEEARYAQLSKGSRPEEINIKESELAETKQDLANYYSTVQSTISDSYNKTDDAVNKQTDLVFSNDQTPNPDLTFSVSDQQIKNNAITARIIITQTLKKFGLLNDSLLSTDKTPAEKEAALADAKSYLLQTQTFLIKISNVLDSSSNLSDATISTYKEGINTGRTNVSTALQNVSGLIDDIASQKITVEKTSRELELAKLGGTAEVLAQQESAIMKAEAGVKSAESNLQKTIIRSPINGIVTAQEAKVGELANAGQQIASVINEKSFKIEASVPEADLIKLKLGDKAVLTLDAYGSGTTFNATIIQIDPAEKIVDGVATYKTTFSLDDPQMPIRSGMTASITIKTSTKENVLILPQKAITAKSNKKYVNLLTANGVVEKEITTGLNSADGNVEILSGLEEGNQIVLPNSSN